MEEKKENRAREMAECYFNDLKKGLKKLDNNKLSDVKREEIEEEVFYNYGTEIIKQYIIILAGGGPAMRITGELDENNTPITARLEYQDWFTEWIKYKEADEEILLRVANYNYFN